MEKNDCTIAKLGKGEVAIYDFGSVRLHAYKTNDPIDDEVFVVEKDGRGFVIEYPCFFDNIKELEGYIAEKGIRIEGILAAYHMAGATFLAGTPVYATASADAYGHEEGADEPSSMASPTRSAALSTAAFPRLRTSLKAAL